ncbi:MAG TPA: VWA domain-containing protein [Gemmataceae bacterium]|jgi:hypothetical protein|nr:VWA domain-containing protein [Gemmataceae bacterium]
MGIGFVNVAMLAGLAAVLIPPLVHLLSRRRHQVVDWGAMQFLQFSQTTRRRLLLEELVLMALRMGLVAILVLALAAPYALTSWLDHSLQRDVVLVVDGSSSMTMTDGIKKTPFDVAREEASAYLQSLLPGDRVALVLARQPPEMVVGELSQDFDYVRAKIEELRSPRANPDWPRTLTAAQHLLRDTGKNPRQEIILFTDHQRFGWADPGTLSQWERLAPQWRVEPEGTPVARPRIVAVHTAKDASQGLPNYALAPLKTTRALAWMGQTLKFSGAVHVEGLKEWIAPHRLYVEVDGKFSQDIDLPASTGLVSGRVSFSFSRRFATPGAHLVSVIIEPDVPRNKRPLLYQVRDCLPADNRQDLVIDVIRSLPVLLVDGDDRLSAESSTFFLDKALAATPDGKQAAAVAPRTVPAREWTPAMLEDSEACPRPRVVILADVPDLTPQQSGALEKFVAEGGGVLIVLGPRLAKAQNTYLYHQSGTFWLSTRLEKIAGDAAKPEFSVSPDLQRIQHPALELFQEGSRSLAHARFPRWWQVTVDPARATLAALLTSGDPLLVEQPYKEGRVLVCTVPLDRSWGATFPSLWDYPVFVHELVFYLADARTGLWNLQPGQPVRVPAQAFDDETGQRPDHLLVVPPQGKPASLKIDAWPWIFNNTGAVGPYRLQGDQGKHQYFVVHGDARESDLTPCTEEDRQKVARWLPAIYGLETRTGDIPNEDTRQDLWWLFLLGVIVLLCGEVWWTRRMVRRRTVVSTNEG